MITSMFKDFREPEDPTKVVGIIDWQLAKLAPLFFYARQSHFLNYHGPPTVGLEPP